MMLVYVGITRIMVGWTLFCLMLILNSVRVEIDGMVYLLDPCFPFFLTSQSHRPCVEMRKYIKLFEKIFFHFGGKFV